LAACLRDVHALDGPDLILHGGDAIYDACEADRAETQAQWQLWQKILRDECRLPLEHCLGNHDLWGGAGGDEAKQWALDEFGLAQRYRSFDRAGWHFIVLDSIQPRGDGYEARLDDEQFAWLKADLKAVARTTPVLVLSHVPILCSCAFFDGNNEATGNWVVPKSLMHVDARSLKDLFHKHPNVKLCLSGHTHLRDRVDYNGVTYLCNGAVSGNWWRGAYQGCQPGYGLIDLNDDGSFDHEYIVYG
jgi:3',5'-cyclic AMP phosphodiesterase CpdA